MNVHEPFMNDMNLPFPLVGMSGVCAEGGGRPRWWVKSNGIGEDSSACALEHVKLDLRVMFSPSLGRSGSYLGSDPAGLAADFCEPNLNEPFMNGGRS